MSRWLSLIAIAILVAIPTSHYSQTSAPPQIVPMIVTVTPWGPDQAALDAARAMVRTHPLVLQYLMGTRNRLLSLELIDSAVPTDPPNGFRVVLYDYTNNHALIVTGLLGRPDTVAVRVSTDQPQASGEEFNAAVAILQRDPILGPLILDGSLAPYPPMPPVIESAGADGQNERTVTVGLHPQRPKLTHEIVGVNLIRNQVVRYATGAPPAAIANSNICGIPSAGQGSPPRGTAGQYLITVTQGGTQIWQFLATRPAASSGTRGSAIEVQFVDYMGKRVLKRGHVPILNVQYAGNLCGPYRDWQWQESKLQADGTDVAPGVRSCPTPAQTILDDGTDVGNFWGFAYYTIGSEVVLVTEMEAGWYRYVNEWRFDVNGTIRPRFRFGTTADSCVCNTHTHHAYFRLDFDIVSSTKNLVSELDSRWFAIPRTVETKGFRTATQSRRWQVEYTGGREKYLILPRSDDGLTDTYGHGDLWILRYHDDELDDHRDNTGGSNTDADLDQFVNGESIQNQDVVVWYGTHSTHQGGVEDADSVGPDLVPVNW